MGMRLAPAARLALSAVILVLAGNLRAEVINNYTSAVNDRFSPGTFPNGTPPTPNPTFLLSGNDLSGIGWVPGAAGAGTKNVTMISDIHYVAAAHAPLGVGATVAFRALDGSYVTRTVFSETPIAGSDVLVGQFNTSSPLPGGPNGVSSYPIATGTLAQFQGQQAYMYGQHAQVGRNTLAQFLPPNTTTVVNVGTGPTNVITSDYDPNGDFDGLPVVPSEFTVTGGDSGSPTFMILGGRVSLVGHHVAQFGNDLTPLGTADSFLSDYTPQLAAQLALTGRTLQVQPVPEPAVILAWALPAVVLIGRYRRRGARAPAV